MQPREELLQMVKIRIVREVGVFPELRPVVGQVYEAERGLTAYGAGAYWVIPDICGKKIVVRKGEAVEVTE